MAVSDHPDFSGVARAVDARRGLGGRLGDAIHDRLVESGFDRLPLRWRFRLVVIAFGMPFLCYIVWAATQQAVLEKARVAGQARATATLLSARFEDHLEQTARLLGTASQPIAAHVDDPVATNALLQGMRSYLPKSADNVGIWHTDGRYVAALDSRSATRGINVADRQYFIDAVASRKLAFEGPMVSRTTGAEIIQFAQPLVDARGVVVGVMTMAMRTSELIAILDPTGSGGDAVITVVDAQGRLIARSVDHGTWDGKPLPYADQLRAAFARGSGASEQAGVDGQMRLYGFSRVRGWPWLVMVGEPVESVTGPVGRQLLEDLAIGIVMFAIAFFVAERLAARTIVPLLQLAADTDRLAAGDLSHRSAVAAGGEIAAVATNFNRMAAVLEERDRALAASRQQLRAIADNVPARICYIDQDERYRFVNEQQGPIPGAAPGDLLGRSLRDTCGEAVYGIVRNAVRDALAGTPSTVEVARCHEDRVYHFLHAYVPDRADDGSIRGAYAFEQDITERKTADLGRRDSERRLVTITDNVPAMICYVDETRAFHFANRTFERWFERPLAEIIGERFDRLLPPGIAAQYEHYFARAMQGESMEYELEVELPRSRPRWLKCAFIADLDTSTGRVRGVYGMMQDVTKQKEAEQRLTRLAQFDTLTGIANRHSFNETLAEVLAATPVAGRLLGLMFLDIDHFKQVNDRHGHGCGDMLLKAFAQRLVDSVRPTDTVARLSGDEFVVLLEDMHSDEEPQFIARKIVAAVEQPFVLDGHHVRVTTSIGIAMRHVDDEAPTALMKRADEALYDAKRSGRNTFRLAS